MACSRKLLFTPKLHSISRYHAEGKILFDPKLYLTTRYHEASPGFPSYVSRAGPLMKYFGKYCKGFRASGPVDNGSTNKTALDLGSGPCMNLSLLMQPYVSRIVHSDYEEVNREELQLWKNNSPLAFDWQPFLRSVYTDHGGVPEGIDVDSYVSQVIKDTRQKVSSVVSCDLRKDPMFDPAVVPEGGFDLIASNQTLSVAATNMEEFSQMFRKVHSIMKEGAVFVCCLTGRATWYCMGAEFPEDKFPILYITEDDIIQAVNHAHLRLVEMDVWPTKSLSSDAHEFQFFACTK